MTEFNKYQSTLEELNFDSYPKEVQDEFLEYLNSVPFIQNLVSPKRPYCKDLPRDDKGRAIIDITNPPIIGDIDYFRPTAIHFHKTGRMTDLRPNRNPNSPYGQWIKEEVNRAWNGMVRPSDGAWITGDMYWYLNYTPIIQSKTRKGTKVADRIVDFPEFWEGIWWRELGWLYARNQGLNFAEIAKRGASKAHPYDQKVYTPDGMKVWRDIHIGDKLFADDGTVTTVIGIPYEGIDDIYRITLRDGRTVEASGEHLWDVETHGHKSIETLSTKQLMNTYKRHRKVSDRNPSGIEYVCSIPCNMGVEFPQKQTKVDPYTFGLLLGDGCFRHQSCYYTCKEDDFKEIQNYIPYKFTKGSGKYAYRLHINGWKTILESYGLADKKSEDKFIPKEYLFNSRQIRLELLKGIIDSDGYLDKYNQYRITITSKKLCGDILWLCRSLGMNCSFTKNNAGYKANGEYRECFPAYTVSIHTTDVLAKLLRKQQLASLSAYGKSRYYRTRIVNIEYIGKKPCKCVGVDSADHCYLIGDFIRTHNSYCIASKLAKNFILGENEVTQRNVRSLVTAYQKEYLVKDGTLNKFMEMRDFLAQNTQFPSATLKRSIQDMDWIMGYEDLDTGTRRGTLNEVIGVSAKDDPDKLRGKRASLIAIEEFGNFPKITDTYNVMLPSVREGDLAFGQVILIGTGGSEGSDFAGAQEMIYHPSGYKLFSVDNVYDKSSQGRGQSIFFFPAYVNRKGCYNKDGVSDVTKALLQICMDRYTVKYNTEDPMQVTRTKAENPITLQDAIMRRDSTLFPVATIMDRLGELEGNPTEYQDVYVGTMGQTKNGQPEFKPTADQPIRNFPHKNNKLSGAVEIYEMPKKDREGKVFSGRYIAGLDPYDDDTSETMSLGSLFVLDLWTDQIVCEYTGRPMFANDYYEQTRLILLFYNARLNYEQNKKGIFAYFSQMNCLYLLTDVLDFLKDKDMVTGQLYGNKAKGTMATQPINNYARSLIRNWLLKPVQVLRKVDNEMQEVTVPNVMTMRQHALLQELAQWNPDGNFDRVSAMGMLMLLREDKMITFGGNPASAADRVDKDYLGKDPFFERNYSNKLSNNKWNTQHIGF